MNNRLLTSEIAALLAEYAGVRKNKAERFIRELTLLICETTFQDKNLKVKGLGTFKIIEVQTRESVDVNTGNRIVIPGHYKFSFIPDKELKEAVNKPFSFFETVEISDHIDSSVFEQVESEKEDLTPTVSTLSEEPGKEESIITEIIEEAIEDLPEESPVSEESVVIEDLEEEDKSEPEIAEEFSQEPPVEEPASEEEIIEEPEKEERIITEAIEETIEDLPEESPVSEESVVIEDLEEEDNKEPEIAEEPDEKEDMRPGFFIPKVQPAQSLRVMQTSGSSKKRQIGWIAAIVIILIGTGSYFFVNRNLLRAWNKAESDLSIAADSIVDTLINEMLYEADEENEEDEIGIEEFIADRENSLSESDNSPESQEEQDEIIATVKIKDGNRLTLISLEYYGNKVFWVYLYEYNKDLIKDPNNVPIGTEIKVPNPELYNINPNSKTSLEKAALLQSQILLAL